MKRTVLIHTFGGLLLGLLLFASTDDGDYIMFSGINKLPLWGGLGAILLYESLRPYFPRLRWGHMLALCAAWALTLLVSGYFLPLFCGVPLTMAILATVMQRPSVLRWTGVMVAGSAALCIGVVLLLQVFLLPSSGAPNFTPLLWTGMLGAAFGVGVHLLAHGLQPEASKHRAARFKAQRDHFFFAEGEHDAY